MSESLPDELIEYIDKVEELLDTRTGTIVIERGSSVSSRPYIDSFGMFKHMPVELEYLEIGTDQGELTINEGDLIERYNYETLERFWNYLDGAIEEKENEMIADILEKVEEYFKAKYPESRIRVEWNPDAPYPEVIVYIDGIERYLVKVGEYTYLRTATLKFDRKIFYFDPEKWKIEEAD